MLNFKDAKINFQSSDDESKKITLKPGSMPKQRSSSDVGENCRKYEKWTVKDQQNKIKKNSLWASGFVSLTVAAVVLFLGWYIIGVTFLLASIGLLVFGNKFNVSKKPDIVPVDTTSNKTTATFSVPDNASPKPVAALKKQETTKAAKMSVKELDNKQAAPKVVFQGVQYQVKSFEELPTGKRVEVTTQDDPFDIVQTSKKCRVKGKKRAHK